MGRLDELKREVAELEAQAKVQQNPLVSVDQAAPAVESDEEQVRRIFDAILGLDGAEERKREEDQTRHVCGSCFLPQPKTNTVCELCGSSAGWLVPSEVKSNHERDMFSRMAAQYTVEQLNTALRSGWATTPQRESFARRLLDLREARFARQSQDSQTDTDPDDSPRSPLDGIDLGRVEKGYDRQIAALDAKLEALNASQQEQGSAGTSAS